MILTCPQCKTRYQTDEAQFPPAGRTVRCGKCRHLWHQPGFAVAPEAETLPRTTNLSPADFRSAHPSVGTSTRPFAEKASVQTQHPTAEAGQTRPVRRAYIALAAAWIVLIVVLLLVALLANHYRDEIARMGARALSLTSSASHQIESQGIELRNESYRREVDDGQTMLVITGTIANSANRELPVPKAIHVTLSDGNDNEFFNVSIPADVGNLGPGQSVTFRTRIHDLPSTDLHLQMHFEG